METFRIALVALRTNKLRSFLTLLGVIIGVTTVVAVVSVISGLNAYVAEKVFSLNPDVLIVTQFGIITSREEFLEAIKRKKIDLADTKAIADRCESCKQIGVSTSSSQPVKRGSKRLADVQVLGVTTSMAQLNNLDIEAGRFFTSSEEAHSAAVAVIGSDVREELFGPLDPVGRSISIQGKPMKVIGLLRKQGSVLGRSQDKQLYIPLPAFRKMFGSRRSLSVFIRPDGGVAGIEKTQDELRVIMRSRRHTGFRDKDPFAVVTAAALQKVWQSISAGAFALMTLISGISLVVGGIVITNIMLVSVVERTREIGLRRAVGARSRDIQFQFLTEAMLLSLIGGIIGCIIGALITQAISIVFPARVTPMIISAGIFIAVLTGIIAGFFPARKAAQLPPVEALRWE